jgi:hypothetical protein
LPIFENIFAVWRGGQGNLLAMLKGITWGRNATPIERTCVRAEFVREDFFGAGDQAEKKARNNDLLHQYFK